MASSHLHPPPYSSVFLEAAVQDMDERTASIIVALNFFILFHAIIIVSHFFCSFNYRFTGIHFSPGSKPLIQVVCT